MPEEDDDPQAAEPARLQSLVDTFRNLFASRVGGAFRRTAWSLDEETVRDAFALAWRCGLTIDIAPVTERKGRPYTLVCTKNRASHQRRLAEYGEDVSHMGSLVRSAPGGALAARCASDLARLREAVAAGKPAGRERT